MALPDPLAFHAVVVNDSSTRTLIVRPAEQRGYSAVLWRQAHGEFMEDQKFRRYGWTPPTVWAHTPSRREAAQGAIDLDGSLRFHFPLRDPAYKELVGKPISAIVTIDKRSGTILGVKFHHKS